MSRPINSHNRRFWARSRNYRHLAYCTAFTALIVLFAFSHSPAPTRPAPVPTSSSSAPHYQPPPPPPKREPVRRPILASSKPGDRNLDSFPRVNIAWGDVLNPAKKIPAQGFAAYYLTTGDPEKVQNAAYPYGDKAMPNPSERSPSSEIFTAYWKENPARLIATENVSAIAVDYKGNEFHGIPSPDFAGYWVGILRVPENADYTFHVEQSWANTRILLNRHRLYESGSEKKTTVRLAPGDYILEVEYLNNFPSTRFNIALDSEPATP